MRHIIESIIGRKGNGISDIFSKDPKGIFHIFLSRNEDVDAFKNAAARTFGITHYLNYKYSQGRDYVSIWNCNDYSNSKHISGGIVNACGEDLARLHLHGPIECRIYKTTFRNVGILNNKLFIDMINGEFDPDDYYDEYAKTFTPIYSGKANF